MSQPGVIDQTARMRDLANTVLQRLLAERATLEQRLAEIGKPDPIKHVTGASALDRAVDTTRRMLEQTNAALGELKTSHTDRPDMAHGGGTHMLEVHVVNRGIHALSGR
jgi:hypothetical protein